MNNPTITPEQFEFVPNAATLEDGRGVAMWGFTCDSMFIVDPYLSCCGRFKMSPDSYGLSMAHAQLLANLNAIVMGHITGPNGEFVSLMHTSKVLHSRSVQLCLPPPVLRVHEELLKLVEQQAASVFPMFRGEAQPFTSINGCKIVTFK